MIPPLLPQPQRNHLRHQPVTIPTSLIPWPEWSERRIGGVSSFGFSGTNVHVIVERAPVAADRAASVDPAPQVVTLTAKSEPALRSVARALDARLEQDPSIPLGDLAFTLNTGRARFAHRAAMVSVSTAQLREQLRAIAAGESAPGISLAQLRPGAGKPKVAFCSRDKRAAAARSDEVKLCSAMRWTVRTRQRAAAARS